MEFHTYNLSKIILFRTCEILFQYFLEVKVELFVFDGINPPVLVADINPGTADSRPAYFEEHDGKLYFQADHALYGKELWVFDPNGVTATRQLNTAIDFSIYPNPSQDMIHIETNEEVEQVELLDMAGKVVMTTKEKTMNVHALSAGIYVLQLTTPKGINKQRFVKK